MTAIPVLGWTSQEQPGQQEHIRGGVHHEGTGKDEDIWKIAFSRAFCEFLSGLKLLTII